MHALKSSPLLQPPPSPVLCLINNQIFILGHNGCICAGGDLIERGNWKRPSASLFDKELTLIEVVAI